MIVYLITNATNGKRYIGQTSKSLDVRWHQHQVTRSCSALRNAVDKYGASSFIREILFSELTKEQATEFEVEYIERYKTKAPNGYNLTSGGEGTKGLSEEIRKKLSEINIGNKNSVGVIRTPEYCKAISDRQKGRQFTEIWRKRMSEAAKVKVVSQETKDKKRERNKRLGIRPPILSSKQAAEAGRISGHKRYHVARNIVNFKCKFCNQI